MGLTLFKNLNLALAFFLEVGVLIAWGYWGFATGTGIWGKVALGLGVPALAVVVWWLFGAPGATWHLEGFWRVLLQVVFFGSAAVALYLANQRTASIVFALLFVLNFVLITIWKQ